jgi:nifR3 family TIM-barrel protein
VGAARPSGIPVTMKFRMGVRDDVLTFVEAGRIGEEEGVAAVALHARTAEQLYSGRAAWPAIAELKTAVTSIPVLGNGDIWEASDAVAMVAETGCDGVVVGRGCLGRPWLFADLEAAFTAKQPGPAPRLGEVALVMAEHARLLVEWFGSGPAQASGHSSAAALRDFRKHTGWYLTGYPAGPEIRRRLAKVESLGELEDLLATLDPDLTLVPGGLRIRRGHTNGPRPVHLPHGWLDDRDDATPLPPEAEALVSGG